MAITWICVIFTITESCFFQTSRHDVISESWSFADSHQPGQTHQTAPQLRQFGRRAESSESREICHETSRRVVGLRVYGRRFWRSPTCSHCRRRLGHRSTESQKMCRPSEKNCSRRGIGRTQTTERRNKKCGQPRRWTGFSHSWLRQKKKTRKEKIETSQTTYIPNCCCLFQWCSPKIEHKAEERQRLVKNGWNV